MGGIPGREFIVVSHPKNTFTSNTRIELMAGDYVMESGNTRIFIDDFYIFRLRWYDYDDLFGGLPWEQQKNESGEIKPNRNRYHEKLFTKRFSPICALAVSVLLLGRGGCSDDDTELVVGSKGGSRTLYVASDAGSRTVRVKANSAWQVRLTPDTRLWVSIDGADSGEMDGAFTVGYKRQQHASAQSETS